MKEKIINCRYESKLIETQTWSRVWTGSALRVTIDREPCCFGKFVFQLIASALEFFYSGGREGGISWLCSNRQFGRKFKSAR